jgi:hypothetical protein
VKFVLGHTVQKKLVSSLVQWDELWPWISLEGESLYIMICYESDGIDGFPIWVTVWVLWWVQSCLQKAFRGICTIWSWGLKLNGSKIIMFHELEQVYLGMENVIRSFDPSPWLIFLILTVACEICIRSHWAKNLLSCFGQWDDLMAKGELGRGIHSYNAM